ncbi:putative mitochondrial protein [Abeliophyllum distichum]|uniref:Mitochondrial protein n=1 Tax=Abeliophyllum distichum TaxID=126358 RepID=A0ABD1UPT1_9LAMI
MTLHHLSFEHNSHSSLPDSADTIHSTDEPTHRLPAENERVIKNDEGLNNKLSQQLEHRDIQPESLESQDGIRIWVDMPEVGHDADKCGHPMVTRSMVGIVKPKVCIAAAVSDSLDEIEPVSFSLDEALKSEKWCKAMKEEYDALIKNQTLVLIPSEPKMKVIGCKWVYKLKFDTNGKIQRHKARLVAKGFSQT